MKDSMPAQVWITMLMDHKNGPGRISHINLGKEKNNCAC